MVRRVVDAVAQAGIGHVVVVLGPDMEDVRAILPPDVQIAIQDEPRGTGDAVRVGLAAFAASELDAIIVVAGDTPLVSAETLRRLLEAVPRATVAVAGVELADPHGYGRLILDSQGGLTRIVEQADASPEELAVHLVAGYPFAFEAQWLTTAVPRITPAPNGEFYLTALVENAAIEGQPTYVVRVDDEWEIRGVNTRRELVEMNAELRKRICQHWLDRGVTILDPASTVIDESATFGQDVVVHPQCYIRGRSVIGEGCILGPGAEIIDSRLGAGTRVWWSVVEGAETAQRVSIGPYFRVRPGTVLGDDVHLGSFGEVKNSAVGAGTQIHHFSYVGDAKVGESVNIGAGAITCNYDGENKHETIIGDRAFIGSDTMLIAPVEIGDGASTGAGAVVTHDVPPGRTAVGVPARLRPERKESDTGTTEGE
ncbi:MAG: bifunctional UDP-N-acetylglucosamine pyrophosphorylase / glucosamine-phosphate N-acetyltransferase [Chloroflexota bacterium]|jgi:bifunctional UDP-N-acetylglucosamine pyrophosphorylase/glucosamine-1-phosphate N-acetyltransferase|nr:bifunctional UDP-N-acetylglucosamine pyrophosphorylase / glucosamine-phosphate N-acetyltransferase [Chloroflexota bacterium]